MKIKNYLIETDILIDFLSSKKKKDNTYLLNIMQKGVCFTSVLNASELYFAAKSDFEREKVNHLLYALKVLGIHSRYSLHVAPVAHHFNNYRDALFYILAQQNNLIIVTKLNKKYKGLDCNCIHPSEII